MGPNGSGKSTLAYVLAGRDGYEVTEGDILWNGESLLEMEPDERAAKGVFLAFQYPMEIPGVADLTFLRTARQRGAQEARRGGAHDARVPEARARARRRGSASTMEMLKRPVNVGFSGGEKKRIGDPADGRAGADAVRARRDRLRPRHRRACASSPTASTRCAPRTGRCWSSPTTSGCSNYIVPDKVHVMAGRPHRRSRAARSWRWSSRRPATPSSRRKAA